MKQKIGNVTLDYTYYSGREQYTDGAIEDVLLEAVKGGKADELLHESDQWAVLYHLSDIRENLLEWYPFEREADILEIGSGCGGLTGLFSRKVHSVTCIELSEKRSMINAYRNKDRANIKIMLGNFEDIRLEQTFDYVTLIGVWEYSGIYISKGGEKSYLYMLEKAKRYLKPDGKIIVAIENKMGLKYWNGAVEDHTGKLYSGMNDYVGEKNVRTFSKQEIVRLLRKAGIEECFFYYPTPDYKLPDCIYTDGKLPEPGDLRDYLKDYNAVRIYNFFDATSWDQICDDEIFSYFSNSFLFICGEGKEKILSAKYNKERKAKYRISTIIKERAGKRYVERKALNREADSHIIQIKQNEDRWKGILPSIEYAPGNIEDNAYISPYVEGVELDTYFYRLRSDVEELMMQVGEIIKNYLTPAREECIPFVYTQEFREVFGERYPKDGYSLKITNVDLTFSNLKLTHEKRLTNFDYEWIFDFPVPYEYVIWRTLKQFYNKFNIYFKYKITKSNFIAKFGINMDNLGVYEEMEKHFTEYVFGRNYCEQYLNHYRKKTIIASYDFR